MADSVISLEYRGRTAVITIDNPKKLNALAQHQYYDLAQKLREVATHDEVFITVLLAKGRFFSAYVSHATIQLTDVNPGLIVVY
jgi:peroxisomal 3,2-trans-enoyl-CoA isomerase